MTDPPIACSLDQDALKARLAAAAEAGPRRPRLP